MCFFLFIYVVFANCQVTGCEKNGGKIKSRKGKKSNIFQYIKNLRDRRVIKNPYT